jgi:hypothetical protein
VRKTVALLAGVASGLVVHESGHVITGMLFNAHPGTRPIRYAGIPFFAVTHDDVSRRKEYVISSAGFTMQHLGSEWLLTTRPALRHERAPFLKGILAFNIATSMMYTGSAVLRRGPDQRDPYGMAVSLGRDGWPEPAMGALLFVPAVLDGYRYLHPERRWAAWTSRGVKVACAALTLAARNR